MALYIGNQKVAPSINPDIIDDAFLASSNCIIRSNGTIELIENTDGDTIAFKQTILDKRFGADNTNYQDDTSIIGINLSGLVSIEGVLQDYPGFDQTFMGTLNLIFVNLHNLQRANMSDALNNAFNSEFSGSNSSNLEHVDLSSLSEIKGNYALRGAFVGSKLTTLSFPSLNSNSFGSYTNQFTRLLYKVTGCTVHFPSNLQSVIGSWTDVIAGFGGTNTTVLFDLPATT